MLKNAPGGPRPSATSPDTKASALARLQRPKIVPTHEPGQREDLLYLVLEFVHGGTLASREARRQAAEAVRGAKEAVKQAQVDTKLALEKVAMMRLAGDLERLYSAVHAVLDFGDHAIWPRALLRCREPGDLAAALRVNPPPARGRADYPGTGRRGADARPNLDYR